MKTILSVSKKRVEHGLIRISACNPLRSQKSDFLFSLPLNNIQLQK